MSAFKWLVNAAQWAFSSSGAPVGPLRVKGACEAVVAQSQADFAVLAQKVSAKEITPAVFEQEMRRSIDRNIIANGALAHGGFDNLTPKILERLSERIAPQYGYLSQFVKEIAAGTQSPAQINARAQSYSNEGRVAYENEYGEAKKQAGFGQACRILGMDDNCEGCLEAAADGWVAIDDLVPIGDAECGARCRCIVVYKLDEEAESADAVESSVKMAGEKLDALKQLKEEKAKNG